MMKYTKPGRAQRFDAGMKNNPTAPRREAGFTLVEWLSVIAIMAVVAGLIVGLAGVAGKAKRKARVTAELNQLVTSIDSYFAKYNGYPPQEGGNYGVNSLYHELIGVKFTPDNATPANSTYTTPDGRVTMTQTDVQTIFGIGGFANVGEGPNTAGNNLLPTIKPNQTALVEQGGGVGQILIVPAEAPPSKGVSAKTVEGDPKTVNPWRYNASNPSNNPNSYDLWAEIRVGDETIIIGNWDN